MITRAARATAGILLAAVVAGVALATGTVFGLMLLSAGLIIPGAAVLLAYLGIYTALRSGLLPRPTRPDPARTVTMPAVRPNPLRHRAPFRALKG